jgi:hypothetical protein
MKSVLVHQFRILRNGRAGSKLEWMWTTVVAWNFAVWLEIQRHVVA